MVRFYLVLAFLLSCGVSALNMNINDCVIGTKEVENFIKYECYAEKNIVRGIRPIGCVPDNDANGDVLGDGDTYKTEYFWYKCSVTGDTASYAITNWSFVDCIGPNGKMNPGEEQRDKDGGTWKCITNDDGSVTMKFVEATSCFYNGVDRQVKETWKEDGKKLTCYISKGKSSVLLRACIADDGTEIPLGKYAKVGESFMKCDGNAREPGECKLVPVAAATCKGYDGIERQLNEVWETEKFKYQCILNSKMEATITIKECFYKYPKGKITLGRWKLRKVEDKWISCASYNGYWDLHVMQAGVIGTTSCLLEDKETKAIFQKWTVGEILYMCSFSNKKASIRQIGCQKDNIKFGNNQIKEMPNCDKEKHMCAWVCKRGSDRKYSIRHLTKEEYEEWISRGEEKDGSNREFTGTGGSGNGGSRTETTTKKTTTKSTTTEPTTPEPTTPKPTTPEPTTPEQTTLEPSTPEPTTPEPTTPESTTPEPTTPEPTTPEPTTPEPTTPELTTPEPTTPEPTTPEPTTPELTTPEPTTPEPTTPESTTPEPTTPEPTTFEPSTLEPTTPEPITPEPTTLEPSTLEPTTPEPTTLEQTTPETTTPELTTPEPEPITPEPTTPEPTTLEPTTPEQTTPEPNTLEPKTTEPTTPEPITFEPTTPEQTTPEPTNPELTTYEPNDEHVTEETEATKAEALSTIVPIEPSTPKTTTLQPTTSEPTTTTQSPTTESPATTTEAASECADKNQLCPQLSPVCAASDDHSAEIHGRVRRAIGKLAHSAEMAVGSYEPSSSEEAILKMVAALSSEDLSDEIQNLREDFSSEEGYECGCPPPPCPWHYKEYNCLPACPCAKQKPQPKCKNCNLLKRKAKQFVKALCPRTCNTCDLDDSVSLAFAVERFVSAYKKQ